MLRLLVTLGIAASFPAFASSEYPTVKSITVFHPMQLRRIDGKVITLKQGSGFDLGVLPPAVNADEKLCGDVDANNSAQTALYLKTIEIATTLMKDKRSTLTADEAALVQTVPRCDPFTTPLSLIAMSISSKPTEKVYGLDQLQFKDGRLELWMDDWYDDENDKVMFATPGLYNFGAAFIPASATGRAISLRIEDLGEDPTPIEGTPVEGRESCTVSVPVQRCDRGSCHTEYEDRPGRKFYDYAPVYYDHAWRITFAAPNGEKLMVVEASTSRSEDTGRSGECRAFDGGHEGERH